MTSHAVRSTNERIARATLALLALVVGALPASADATADDLAVVKKAMAGSARVEPAPSPAARPVPAEAAPAPHARPHRVDEPAWFRVRIVEKGAKGAEVKVNLPLFLVRALGDEIPLPGCEGRRHRTTVGEVLRALDSGESLVEIDDVDASVRIWVE